MKTVSIFYCYAHTPKDERWLQQLKISLSGLRQNGQMTFWHDRDITAGQELSDAIYAQLDAAHVILLLVSPDFMADEDCNKMVHRALERHEAKEARVIPIILRPVDWKSAPFSKLKMLPDNGKPISSRAWKDSDEAFLNITLGMKAVIGEIHKSLVSQNVSPLTDTFHNSEALPPLSRPDASPRKLVQSQALKGMLAYERQKQQDVLPASPQPSFKLDRDLIISYDLSLQMAVFQDCINYGEAVAISLNGRSKMIKNYIIERMCQEQKNKLRRPYRSIEISLDNPDVSDREGDLCNIIQNKVLFRSQCSTFAELFTSTPTSDIVLVIWTYTFPSDQIHIAATSFWKNVKRDIVPILEEQGQCFTVILANTDRMTNIDSIDYFIPIKLPERLEERQLPSLEKWVRGRLKNMGVEQEDIEHCIKGLLEQSGYFFATYNEMENIIDYLRGRYIPL